MNTNWISEFVLIREIRVDYFGAMGEIRRRGMASMAVADQRPTHRLTVRVRNRQSAIRNPSPAVAVIHYFTIIRRTDSVKWLGVLIYARMFPAVGPNDSPSHNVILIAEDDENDVFLIKRALHQAQFDNPLHVVRNGEEAIAYLKGSPPFEDREKHPMPALLLLDLKMPRKNGFEVLTWLRQHPEYNSLAVVVLTSSQESADVNRAYALGANSYLVKPANFLSLVDMIARLKEYCRFTSQSVGTTWV